MKVERGSKAKVVGVLAARDLQCHLLQGVADTLVRVVIREKNGIMWEKFPNGGPPTPPVWETPVIKKKSWVYFSF